MRPLFAIDSLLLAPMYQSHSIDIVIPSYRLDDKFLLPILALKNTKGWQQYFIVVADNPLVNVPSAIRELANQDDIKLIINNKNEGPSETRNIGINQGNSTWILLLDDDITPEKNLIDSYIDAIHLHPGAIGFVGVTDFPTPFNAATRALKLNGSVGHFQVARKEAQVVWAPTANLMLNRHKLDSGLFDAQLKTGEDIEFLARNFSLFGEKYISVPAAIVHHPWWNDGAVQSKRMFLYGIGASEIALKPAIKNYRFKDFTNTAESLLLLILLSPIAINYNFGWELIMMAVIIILAEIFTNLIKSFQLSATKPLITGLLMCWSKNCYEAGYLYGAIRKGRISGFAERLELGFQKKNPGWFRTNRWKIIKLTLVVLLLITFICFGR